MTRTLVTNGRFKQDLQKVQKPDLTQLTFTFSKGTIETLVKGVKYIHS